MHKNLPDLTDAAGAAKILLGWKLVHESEEGVTEGIIVETEAYHQDDPASHTYRGRTKRNAGMFESAGIAYVYFTYGMHYCFNIVTGSKGVGQAVLVRALEPTGGLELMKHRRQQDSVRLLTNGPAKLSQAMGITAEHYGNNLFDGRGLYLKPGLQPTDIVTATRIGISRAADIPWRFYIDGNAFVSKPGG